jgi:hypothetical protein
MKKMQEKSKRYKYTRKSTNCPSNQAIRMANTNFPSQSNKARRVKGFDEDVSQLSLCIDISHLNISLLNVISQEMVSHSLVEDWVFGYRDDTGVITHEGNSLKGHYKISHGVHNLYDVGAAATYSASMVDCATKDCF